MLTWLYHSVCNVRNDFYNRQIFKTSRVDKPVLSIGNLTMGGTGKTPIVDHLLKWTQQQQLSAGVVSRGYRGKFKGVQKVPRMADPEIYGDEPSMLSLRNQDTPIYICPNRVLAARELIKNEKVDLIIADDAFQHRRLGRDLDIVVVDLLEPQENYGVLPFGKAREPLKSLSRADIIILNKANLVTPQQLHIVQNFLAPYSREDCLYIQGEYHAGDLLALDDQKQPEKKDQRGRQDKKELDTNDFLLLSGIGRPRTFETLVRNKNLSIVQHLIYRDHHRYTLQNVEDICKMAVKIGVPNILCTQKDAVKLKKWIANFSFINWFYLDMNVELIGAEKLYEKIHRLCS